MSKSNLTRLILIARLAVGALMLAQPLAAVAVTDQEIAAMQNEPAGAAPVIVPANEGPGLAKILVRMGVSLAVVFALIGAAVWLARRYMPQARPGARRGAIQILATQSLGARRSLLLVKANGRTLLLGMTPQSIRSLGELDDEAPEHDVPARKPSAWNANAWDAAAFKAGLEPSRATTGLERAS